MTDEKRDALVNDLRAWIAHCREAESRHEFAICDPVVLRETLSEATSLLELVSVFVCAYCGELGPHRCSFFAPGEPEHKSRTSKGK